MKFFTFLGKLIINILLLPVRLVKLLIFGPAVAVVILRDILFPPKTVDRFGTYEEIDDFFNPKIEQININEKMDSQSKAEALRELRARKRRSIDALDIEGALPRERWHKPKLVERFQSIEELLDFFDPKIRIAESEGDLDALSELRARKRRSIEALGTSEPLPKERWITPTSVERFNTLEDVYSFFWPKFRELMESDLDSASLADAFAELNARQRRSIAALGVAHELPGEYWIIDEPIDDEVQATPSPQKQPCKQPFDIPRAYITGSYTAARITQERAKKSLPPAMLADMVGVSKETVLAWEAGTKTPTANEIERLCKVFKIPTDELIDCTADDEEATLNMIFYGDSAESNMFKD